jgi:hypothetical protein
MKLLLLHPCTSIPGEPTGGRRGRSPLYPRGSRRRARTVSFVIWPRTRPSSTTPTGRPWRRTMSMTLRISASGATDLARGAALHDAPALHQRDAVADLERLVQVVADEDDGALQLAAGPEARPAACDRISGSSAEKGSSIRRIGASVTKARARPTRCCMPPDRSPTLRSAHCVRFTSASCTSTLSRRVRATARPVPAPAPRSRAPCARAAGRTAGTPSRSCSAAAAQGGGSALVTLTMPVAVAAPAPRRAPPGSAR